MPDERRLDTRAKVNLPARWESFLTQQEATVIDLSRTGCFVLSGGKVQPNELIRLEITLPNDERVYPWAEVVEEADEIGFAVRFTSMDDDERDRLEQFVRRTLTAR
jgi:hypothetical protein